MLLIALRALWLVMLALAVIGLPVERSGSARPNAFSRFEPLRSHLPAEGAIGFFTGNAQQVKRLRDMAQYVLAPLVVDDGQEHFLAVADFVDESQLQHFLAESHYQLRTRVAEGLAVLERTGP